ncbi:hypothetical protein B5X24_HaOG213475 [Helicoverpa armigera]|uniref:Uncharacterized protein n=2 Tax=Helicoverpa armigera TaxID=29058 RepID=A0A2W1B9I6_HELAM|nr:hypothetical protein B5X24_HaOG213475 [Helicoverpa armigera]
MLNNLYGAVCDNQYLLTAMPGMARRIPARRNLSDDKPEWENTSDNLTTYEQENKVSDILDTWRDPLTTKVQLGNPPDEQDDENFKGHNLSLL